MAGDKYLTIGTDGEPAEVISIQSSAGVGSAGEIVALDGTGKIAANMMPSGIGAEQIEITAQTGGLPQWSIVNIYMNAAVLTARLADGGTNKYPAHAYVPEAILTGALGNVQMEGIVTASGMTPGKAQFLDVATPGARTETVPAGAGKLNQKLGYALSATEWKFEVSSPIVLAS